MSFKQFYEKASNGIVELNEALELFYLSEGFENGVKVSLTSTGKGKIKDRFIGAQHPAFDRNDFDFYKTLAAVPADKKESREIVVAFGGTKFVVKKNLSLELNLIPTDFISELSTSSKIGNKTYQDKLQSINQRYTKELVTSLLKDYTKTDVVKSVYSSEEIKKYSKELIAYFESVGAFAADFAKNYNKKIPKTEDISFKKFVGSGISGFGEYVTNFNKKEIGTAFSPISDEDLDYLLFGSAENTAGFERAWKEYAATRSIGVSTLKLNKFYLYSESGETLIEVAYNEDQKDSTPEELLDVSKESNVEEKESKKPKKYNVELNATGRETCQALGVYFPSAPEVFHKVEEYIEANGEGVDTSSQNFKKAISGLESTISTFTKSAGISQESKAVLSDILTKGNVNDYSRLLSLAAGVALFKKKIAPSYSNIVFEKMGGTTGYRALEAKKMGYKEGSEYGKATTADMLIANVDDSDLLKLLKSDTTKLEAAKNGSINVVDGEGNVLANYFAVSLKTVKNVESAKGGSIGRTQSLAKKILGDKVLTAGKEMYNESTIEEMFNINESVFTKLSELGKKALLSLKELGVSFVSRVAKLANSLRSLSKTSLKAFLAKVNSSLPHSIHVLYDGKLEEATLLSTENMGAYFDKLAKSPEKIAIYNRGNAVLTKVLDSIGNDKGPIGNVSVELKVGTPKDIDANAFKRQTFHYSYITAYAEMFLKSGISQTQKGVVESIHTIVDLYAEAIFGATKLPLWRVYSYTGAGSHVYDNAMSKEAFSSEKKAKLEKISKDMILMNLRGNTVVGHIYIDFLVDIMDDEGKQTYAVYELGYGGSDGYSSSAKFLYEVKK